MLKRFGISALMLCSTLAFAQPQAARAADRDDYRRPARYETRYDSHREHEEHESRFVRSRYNGYYDRAGCWHSYGYR